MAFWDGSRWVRETPAQPPTTRRRTRHALGAIAEAGLITALTFGLIAGTTLAAKGGGHSGSTSSTSLTGPSIITDADANGVVSAGDTIGFTVSTSVSRPEVGLRCWQGTQWVFDAYVSYFDSWLSPKDFLLSSSYWDASKPATCTARLFYYNNRGSERVLATLDFDVAS